MQSAIPSRHPKYRTKLCRNFTSGNCPFGQKCSFVHPAPRISPSPSSLAQQLLSWNPLLLSQLLALSSRQGTQREMPRRSPPRSQGPQLVDEDPSPSTSLLLSKSDCTPSEQMHTRRSSRRKKYPCRHFVRTGGWCPAAGQCRFYHDVTALPPERVRKAEHAPPFGTSTYGGRTISGGVLMGKQVPSPPITDETHPEPPRYPEAELVQPYQPLYWPTCNWQPYPAYYATMPATAVVPIPATAATSSVAQHSVYPLSQAPAQTAPPGETQSLPLGTYEVNGTTYFPTSMPSVPAPPPTYSFAVPPVPYNHTVAPTQPYYAPTLPVGYYDVPGQATDTGPQTSFNPFASDPMMPCELPVIPPLEDYQVSPEALPLPLASPFAPSSDLGLLTTPGKPTVTPEHEFPYRPPKNQQVGHARRISVNIKKQGRANSG